MKLLLESTEDIRKFLGALYASQDFEGFRNYLRNASYEVTDVISQAVYDKAVSHYDSADFLDGNHQKEDDLVELCQEVIAKLAYLEWAPTADVSHDVNGRRMHVDEDSKAPWEWMLRNADQSVFRQYQKGMNRLLDFLDTEQFAEWKESDEFKARQELFCSRPGHIDPLRKSHWFYSKSLSFNREAQVDHVRPVLGSVRYDALVKKLKDGGDPTGDEIDLLHCSRKVIRHRVMERVAYEFPIEYLPEGTVQRFQGDSGKKQSKPASPGMLERTANYHREQAKVQLGRLQEKVKYLNAQQQPAEEDASPYTKTDDKFFRL